jgi:hypothetical protein
VSTALFGSTAGENQGETGQSGSAANFLPAPRKAGDPHAEAWLAWLQAGRDRKEAAHAAAQRKTNHTAHQGGGTRTPQVSTALSGSTVGKNQGKTGQGVSAADFLPAPRKSPYAAHQGGGTCDPPELAPFSSAALYGPPTVAYSRGKLDRA